MTAIQFQGFKPEAMQRIAGTLGYKGDMKKFKDFLKSDPEALSKFEDFQSKAIQMVQGGMVRKQYHDGGVAGHVHDESNPDPDAANDGAAGDGAAGDGAAGDGAAGDGAAGDGDGDTTTAVNTIGQTTVDRMQAPALPTGGKVTATGIVAQTSEDIAAGSGAVGTFDAAGNRIGDPAATASEGVAKGTGAFRDPRKSYEATEDTTNLAKKGEYDTLYNNLINSGAIPEQVITAYKRDGTVTAGYQGLIDAYDAAFPKGAISNARDAQTGKATATVTADKAETRMGEVVGGVTRDYKQVGADEAGFTPPPAGTPVTAAAEAFHNPITGEIVTVNTGGYTAPKGWVKGAPTEQFQEGGAKAAQGTVSDRAEMDAVTASATDVAGLGLKDEYDKDGKLITKGIEQILTKDVYDKDGNLIKSANVNQIDALNDATKRKLQTENVYDADGNIISYGEIVSEAGFTDKEQSKVDTTIDKAKAAQIDTGARDTYDKDGNLIKKGDKGYTVKAQLEGLMEDFEGGASPAWAAGAMRQATATLAARGLGASSMAGQAIVQAAMEASLPIAQADAATIAQFERDNLSNRQQTTMLAAQQRADFLKLEFDQKFQSRVINASKISDIANLNFTADQQITLENARIVATADLSNMSAKNAKIMADAATMAAMDFKNLDNKQQAAALNAKALLDMDFKNLDNRQQVQVFKNQARANVILSDQAATNAAKQFNASSENQAEQFFTNLREQVSQFNVAQSNAMEQFNKGEENSIAKFNQEVVNQRDQFNAQNALVVAQSNAVWRREIATASNAATNRANELNAAALLDVSNTAYNNLWQEHADQMEWAWTSSDNERDRQNAVTLSHLAANRERTQAEMEADLASSNLIGDFVGTLMSNAVSSIV